MNEPHPRYRLRVERELNGTSGVEIRLVRYGLRPQAGWLRRLRSWLPGRRPAEPGIALFSRHFRPMLELSQLEAYASLLERVAEHGNQGTLGCFVDMEPRDGCVEVALYERWFDGQQLHCEQLASRSFDASDESAFVSSAEFRGILEQWAEEQNEARDESYLDAATDAQAQAERALARESAARDLAEILSRS